jgi:hypothetical protein
MLQQRNVLECSRVIDHLGLKAREDFVQQGNIIDASQDRLAGRFHLLPDLKEVVLRRIEQQDTAWTSGRDRLD